ncbi:cold shock domain-containing protein 4-like [Nicotiana sylvestris]|uniref:cold shock domain-containing protein 4-like n=1 Tax=Nicotiana sylvestris TaxID=4096 RepID=UPI00388CE07E
MPGAPPAQLVVPVQEFVVPAMSDDEQRRLERFGRLQPPSFSGAEGEDAQGCGYLGSQQGQSSLSALPAQSSSRAPSVQGSSVAGPSSGHSGSRGSLQSPSPAPGSCYECVEFGHMRRQCPQLRGG